MQTAHSPCAHRALRPEDAPARLVPPHVLAAPPLDVEEIIPTLYDPKEFAALYHVDKERALALVATMTEPQRVRQALAYAAWLDHHGLEIRSGHGAGRVGRVSRMQSYGVGSCYNTSRCV